MDSPACSVMILCTSTYIVSAPTGRTRELDCGELHLSHGRNHDQFRRSRIVSYDIVMSRQCRASQTQTRRNDLQGAAGYHGSTTLPGRSPASSAARPQETCPHGMQHQLSLGRFASSTKVSVQRRQKVVFVVTYCKTTTLIQGHTDSARPAAACPFAWRKQARGREACPVAPRDPQVRNL